MALVSPGVQVTITDQSQYLPSVLSSVPYVILVTAQNKVSGSGVGIAPGTLKANANKLYLITSQQDLLATFGQPLFYTDSAGTPINGSELNEYGLMAAYSALGQTNRIYIQRADIDLSALQGTLVRPTGKPADGTYWFDTGTTSWGINIWNQATNQYSYLSNPIVITDDQYVVPNTAMPVQTLGTVGDYAIVTVSQQNQLWYKRGSPTPAEMGSTGQSQYPKANPTFASLQNTWVQVGTIDWISAWPAMFGSGTAQAGNINTTTGTSLVFNSLTYSAPGGTNASAQDMMITYNSQGNYPPVSQPAGIDGSSIIMALQNGVLNTYYVNDNYPNNSGQTQLKWAPGTIWYYDQNQSTNPSPVPGRIKYSKYNGWPVNQGAYINAPQYVASPNTQTPPWNFGTQTTTAPTGSIWQCTNRNVSYGMKLKMRKYNAALDTWVDQAPNVYTSDPDALYNLDPVGGGLNIPVNTIYAEINPFNPTVTTSVPFNGNTVFQRPTSAFQFLQRFATGQTSWTAPNLPQNMSQISQFTISWSTAGVNSFSAPVTINLPINATPSQFISAFNTAQPQLVFAQITNGYVEIIHTQGGSIQLSEILGTPLEDAGIVINDASPPGIRFINVDGGTGNYQISNWDYFDYITSPTSPKIAPANGTPWYYDDPTQVDIMIQNNGSWYGYRNVSNSYRGENLTQTDPKGPIISYDTPVTQTDGTPLVPGDLWIDTADLDHYPAIYRWQLQSNNSTYYWTLINNTDHITPNGILFADARWAPNGTTNPLTDPFPTIVSLLTSNYLDIDAPNPAQYPTGTLLFNTRRSGYNVKQYQANYFSFQNFPDASYPAQPATWVSMSGNRADGSPYMGQYAQRQVIVKALKSGVDTNYQVREEQVDISLLTCPQYPEVAPNLVALNAERRDTSFVLVDTPMDLSPADIVTWATNNNGLGTFEGTGLQVGDPYAATFYPSCLTNDLSGKQVVCPPTYMMLRTILRNDSVSYPWLAPAGTQRGLVDNALQIGYIDQTTDKFTSIGINQGIRDVLYTNRINPITALPGVGIVNFGNKTTTGSTSALDRINVSRLVAYLRSKLEAIAKLYLFEPNDEITRNNVSNAITALMVDLVSKRALYDYLIVCDLTNNTPDRINRNELWIDIAIEPVKSIEFIYIPVRIVNTGSLVAG